MSVKSIPYPYGKADRKLLDKIEHDRKSKNGKLDEYWQVGQTICTRNNKGYYHCFVLVKDVFLGKGLRDYRIAKDGNMVETDSFYSLPTKEDFIQWCKERNIDYKEE